MPCDYSKYPPNWKTEIRPRILARAGDKCEGCGVENHALGFRDKSGDFCKLAEGLAGDIEAEDARLNGFKTIQIVLTIAHMADPDPMNCADDNLKALCQRCHNRHDAPMRKVNAARTRAEKKLQNNLF